jgi:hypothetical protein
MKDQSMKKTLFVPLALASLFVLSAARCGAVTFRENFSTDPLQDGWQVFGDTNLFQWDSTNRVLDVTWDSSQTNSYFYHPLGTTVTRNDDFSITFDLQLKDITSGTEPDKISPMEIGFSLLKHAGATAPGFSRSAYGVVSNLVELDIFPSGFYRDYLGNLHPIVPTVTPTVISTNAYEIAPTAYDPYKVTFPTGELVHVTLAFTASNQMFAATFQTNGVDCVEIPPVVLTDDFAPDDDYTVDMFSISSYSSAGDPYDSVLAHGTVANIVVTIPPPMQNVTGAFSNGVWQVQFTDHLNWLYTLQRMTDFQSWTNASIATAGNGTNLFLQDTNPRRDNAFYRVKAERP